MAFAEMINDLGIGIAIIQKPDLNEKDIITSFYTSLGLGIVFTILLFLIAPVLAYFFNNEKLLNVIRLLSVSIFIISVRNVPLNLLQRDLKFKAVSAGTIVSNIAYGAASITYALLGYGVWNLFTGLLPEKA